MRASRGSIWMARLGAAFMALTVFLTLAPHAAQAVSERALTQAEESRVNQTIGALGPVLLRGGLSQQEAGLAMNAVRVCLRMAYANDLSQATGERVCGLVLDAFTVDKGATQYTPTQDDQMWIMTRVVGWTEALKSTLSQDELGAVRSTMAACLEGHMRRGEDRDDILGHCAMGLLPLLNESELRVKLLQAR